MNLHNLNDKTCKEIAESYCDKHECLYLSHEHYYHSNGNWNWLHIAAEDCSGKFELRINLNKELN